ncbi:hypothetical protein SAMN04515671_0078 [Nakamurella panacisegetis]|uniref:Uncharacterized protein n=1 Tax=Nakamurella panacisegetis TaxID=1090615 RepID=A0A1H0HIN1_9ACTN|nr:hypothetical protein [Nakamurella panacisegetis]SDO18701.1 hypothetical protein SAMN04515671_0078 [Nakamurella panacisegetis]
MRTGLHLENYPVPRHSIFAVKLTAHAARTSKEILDVTNLDKAGHGVLEVFHRAMQRYKSMPVSESDLVDTKAQRFVTVEEVVPLGQWVQASIDSGHYGQPGRVRSAKTGEVEHIHDGESSATSIVRVLALAPPGATAVVLIFEKVGLKSVSGTVIKPLKAALKARFPALVFESETITETSAWLEDASVEKLTATYSEWVSDRAEAGEAPPISGEYVVVLRPVNGLSLWKRLRSKEITPGKLIGVPMRDEPNEAEVQVTSLGKTKTFVIGNERTPGISELVSDGSKPLTDSDFRTACFSMAKEISLRVTGQKWEGTYEHGPWDDERLKWPGGGSSDE